MHRTACIAVIALIPGLASCRTSDSLGPSGTWAPHAPASVGPLPPTTARKVAGNEPEDEDLTAYKSTVEDILNALFGEVRNPELPDVLMYFPSGSEPRIPLLSYRGEIVRVLDREAAIWAVVVIESAGKCPEVTLRLTGTGHTRPAIAVDASSLLAAVASRKELDPTSIEPKQEVVSTKRMGRQMCYAVQRFVLPQDTTLHLTASFNRESTSTDSAVLQFCTKDQPACPESHADSSSFQSATRHWACRATGMTCAIDSAAGGGARSCVPKSVDCGGEMKCEVEPTVCSSSGNVFSCPAASVRCVTETAVQSTLNFANGRWPLNLASIGLGAPIYTFGKDGGSCWDTGGCRPSLYLLGHVYQGQLRWHAKHHTGAAWDTSPSLSGAIVLGVRVLDPIFGDVVAGLRLGAENGRGDSLMMRGVSRFGLVLGATYAFRTFSSKTTTTSTTVTDAAGSTTKTETSSTDVAGGNRFGLLTALDFAF